MHSTINKLCLDAISFPGIHFYGFLRNLQDIKKRKNKEYSLFKMKKY